MQLEVVHEDAELLVINKPAGLVCHPTKPDGYSSLISRVRDYLGPAALPHLINRLDRETSGLVVVAKDPTTARALRRPWENRQVQKHYLAIVHGHLRESQGVIDAPLGKDEQSRVATKNCVREDGASARTEFTLQRSFTRSEGTFSLVHVRPLTGRKHQIRIHLAHIGHPIVGDKLYGDDESIYLDFVHGTLSSTQRAKLVFPNHALHAEQICFPWCGRPMVLRANPEPWFTEFARESQPLLAPSAEATRHKTDRTVVADGDGAHSR
jgi:23S rRNA pseudouridine1911/1915/1917 synthase